MTTKYILITKELHEELTQKVASWIKDQNFAYHSGEIMAEQILVEYLANALGFTTFEDRASYGL